MGHCFCLDMEMTLSMVFIYPQPRLTPTELNGMLESLNIAIQCLQVKHPSSHKLLYLLWINNKQRKYSLLDHMFVG